MNRRPQQGALFALVGAALFGLGVLVGRLGAGRAPAPRPPDAASAPVAVAAGPRDAGAADAARPRDAARPVVQVSPAGELGVVRGRVPAAAEAARSDGGPPLVVALPAPEAVPVPADPGVEAVVEGVVRDERGVPLAGALVGPARMGTGPDGAFLVRVPAGAGVRVEHPAYPAVRVPYAPQLDVVLTPGGGVEGQVRDGPSGVRVMRFSVSASGPEGASARAAGRDGFFRLLDLAPGRWRITVSAEGRAGSRDVDVPAGRSPGEVTVRDVLVEIAG